MFVTGRVKFWMEEKGYGFIERDGGGPDDFFHRFGMADQSWSPHIGAPVRYAVGRSRDGRDRAIDVMRVE